MECAQNQGGAFASGATQRRLRNHGGFDCRRLRAVKLPVAVRQAVFVVGSADSMLRRNHAEWKQFGLQLYCPAGSDVGRVACPVGSD
jgi:hypothetical protein